MGVSCSLALEPRGVHLRHPAKTRAIEERAKTQSHGRGLPVHGLAMTAVLGSRGCGRAQDSAERVGKNPRADSGVDYDLPVKPKLGDGTLLWAAQNNLVRGDSFGKIHLETKRMILSMSLWGGHHPKSERRGPRVLERGLPSLCQETAVLAQSLALKARSFCCLGHVGSQAISRGNLAQVPKLHPGFRVTQGAQLSRQRVKSSTMNLGMEQNEALHWPLSFCLSSSCRRMGQGRLANTWGRSEQPSRVAVSVCTCPDSVP